MARSIYWLILATLCLVHVTVAEAQPRQNQCSGVLHRDQHRIWLGGGKGEGEGICIVSASEESKVLAICSVEKPCTLKGRVELCKDSGECVEITNINAVETRPQVSQSLPPMVDAEIKKAQSSCAPEHVTLGPGFVTEIDINADGVKDYVLDYGKFICGNSSTYFCGTAGCTTQVFASLPGGGYVKALDENVRDIKFRTVKGRPAMILDLHGSMCGRVGAAQCGMTLYWNGAEFSAAN
jgi:hypothetical protein